MVMKEKTPFDFSLVFIFKGTQEGFAVLNASKRKLCKVFITERVYLPMMAF
jgi:hypothetical protein